MGHCTDSLKASLTLQVAITHPSTAALYGSSMQRHAISMVLHLDWGSVAAMQFPCTASASLALHCTSSGLRWNTYGATWECRKLCKQLDGPARSVISGCLRYDRQRGDNDAGDNREAHGARFWPMVLLLQAATRCLCRSVVERGFVHGYM